MSTDQTLLQLRAARAAVEAVIDTRGHDALASQLKLAMEALQTMVDDLAAGPTRARDMSWLAQMVADQWDPSWPLTETVVRASQAYSKAIAKA